MEDRKVRSIRHVASVASVAAALALGGCGTGSVAASHGDHAGGSPTPTSASLVPSTSSTWGQSSLSMTPSTPTTSTSAGPPSTWIAPAPLPSSTTGTMVPQRSGPVGCLRPRTAGSLPAGGWLPASSGAVDYEPEDAGTQQPPSATAEALAARFIRDVEGDGATITVREFASSACVVDWDVVLAYPDGSFAFLRVLQLSAPIELGSFPLVGDGLTQSRDGDVSVYWSALRDRSWEGELAVRDDGLLVEIHVRSGSGPDTTGYPTTMTLPPPPGGSRPAPVPPATVRFTALDILQWVAAS